MLWLAKVQQPWNIFTLHSNQYLHIDHEYILIFFKIHFQQHKDVHVHVAYQMKACDAHMPILPIIYQL